jgi:hypothetical protein
MSATNISNDSQTICAASVKALYAPPKIRSTNFCNFISPPRKSRQISPISSFAAIHHPRPKFCGAFGAAPS